MLKNKPRKPTNKRAYGPPRGLHYRRNRPRGRYLVRPIDRSVNNRFFASRPKAKAYGQRLADSIGRPIEMLDWQMEDYGQIKFFNPRNRPKW